MTSDDSKRVEQVTPYGSEGTAKTEQVRQMFDSIAPAYDFMNRAMTLGIDIWWRKLAVKRRVVEELHAPRLGIRVEHGDRVARQHLAVAV